MRLREAVVVVSFSHTFCNVIHLLHFFLDCSPGGGGEAASPAALESSGARGGGRCLAFADDRRMAWLARFRAARGV